MGWFGYKPSHIYTLGQCLLRTMNKMLNIFSHSKFWDVDSRNLESSCNENKARQDTFCTNLYLNLPTPTGACLLQKLSKWFSRSHPPPPPPKNNNRQKSEKFYICATRKKHDIHGQTRWHCFCVVPKCIADQHLALKYAWNGNIQQSAVSSPVSLLTDKMNEGEKNIGNKSASITLHDCMAYISFNVKWQVHLCFCF